MFGHAYVLVLFCSVLSLKFFIDRYRKHEIHFSWIALFVGAVKLMIIMSVILLLLDVYSKVYINLILAYYLFYFSILLVFRWILSPQWLSLNTMVKCWRIKEVSMFFVWCVGGGGLIDFIDRDCCVGCSFLPYSFLCAPLPLP